VSEVVNFLPLLNSLKIKQSLFKMIYGHVSIFKILCKSVIPSLSQKIKNISFKYPNEDHQQFEAYFKVSIEEIHKQFICQSS